MKIEIHVHTIGGAEEQPPRLWIKNKNNLLAVLRIEPKEAMHILRCLPHTAEITEHKTIYTIKN
jgi:hypothetical protein